jgi:GTP-binding protein
VKMKIVSAECIISAVGPNQYPATGHPEVAMVGRSNVGKSSLINSLCAQRALARTSGRPGKTQTINYFAVNGRMYLVDLPGYGYAETSKGKRDAWGEFITDYLEERDRLALIVHLVDLRHPPMTNDKNASEWLLGLNVPYVLVATKADKITRGKRAAHIAMIRRGLMLPARIPSLVHSKETGEGREELWSHIRSILEQPKAF